MQTERISTNLSCVLLILCLFLLGTIMPTDLLFAQKCVNTAAGELYLDQNRNEIPEPTEEKVSGPVFIIAETTSKERSYEALDGTFVMADLDCDRYTVRYNDVIVGSFEVSEVIGYLVHSFPITPEIYEPDELPETDEQPGVEDADITPGQSDDGTSLEENFQLYLPLITK